MKKLILIFMFASSISYSQTFGTIRDTDHDSQSQGYVMKNNCGHGNQPPCTIPLDNEIWILVVAGILLSAYLLKRKNVCKVS